MRGAAGPRSPGRHTALWTVAVTAAAAGVVLRFIAPSPMWLDEALSVNIASLAAGDAVEALRHDGHPLLYYLLLGAWLDAFGDSDAAARSLSAVFSLAAVPAMWAAARRRLGPLAARYTAVLALTSPFAIRYGSEARMYALVVLLASVGWLLTELALDRPSPWRLASVAVAVAAGLHTHYWMIWLTAAASGVLALAWRGAPARRRTLTLVGAAYGCGWLALVPWAPILASQAAHTGTPWAKWARPAEVAVEAIEGIGGGTRFEPVLLGVLLAGAVLLGATLVSTGARTVELGWPGRHPGAPLVAVAVLTLGLGGVVAMLSSGAFEARYVAVVVPLLLGLAARGLSGLPRWLAPAALAAVAVFGVVVAVDEARRDRTQGQEVAESIDRAAGAGDVVIACPDQLAPAVLRYLDSPATVLTHPPTGDPRFVDWYDYRRRIDEASVRATAATALDTAGAGGAVWLVTASGYRGFEGLCDRIAAELRLSRQPETVVFARPVYEHMRLYRYPATAP